MDDRKASKLFKEVKMNSSFSYDISTPEEGEVCAGLRVVGDHIDEPGNRSSPAVPFSSRSSSLEEDDDETEDDPDWCAEDPDDPEWTGREEAAVGPAGPSAGPHGTHGKRRTSTASGFGRWKSPSVLCAASSGLKTSIEEFCVWFCDRK